MGNSKGNIMSRSEEEGGKQTCYRIQGFPNPTFPGPLWVFGIVSDLEVWQVYRHLLYQGAEQGHIDTQMLVPGGTSDKFFLPIQEMPEETCVHL